MLVKKKAGHVCFKSFKVVSRKSSNLTFTAPFITVDWLGKCIWQNANDSNWAALSGVNLQNSRRKPTWLQGFQSNSFCLSLSTLRKCWWQINKCHLLRLQLRHLLVQMWNLNAAIISFTVISYFECTSLCWYIVAEKKNWKTTSGHKWKRQKQTNVPEWQRWRTQSHASHIHPCLFFSGRVFKMCNFSKWKNSICWVAYNYEHSGSFCSACLSRRDKDSRRARKSRLPDWNAGKNTR